MQLNSIVSKYGTISAILFCLLFLTGCGTRTARPNEAGELRAPLYAQPAPVVFDACIIAARNYCHRVDIIDRDTWHITIYDSNFWAGDVKVVINLEPWEGKTMVRIEAAPYGINGLSFGRYDHITEQLLQYIADQMRMIQDRGK